VPGARFHTLPGGRCGVVSCSSRPRACGAGAREGRQMRREHRCRWKRGPQSSLRTGVRAFFSHKRLGLRLSSVGSWPLWHCCRVRHPGGRRAQRRHPAQRADGGPLTCTGIGTTGRRRGECGRSYEEWLKWGLLLLRVLRRHAIVPDVSPTVLPSARAKGPAAPAGLTSLTSDAAPCHRAGCDRLQYRHQRERKALAAPAGLHLSRALRCQAIVPVAITYSAAISACEKSQQHQQALQLL